MHNESCTKVKPEENGSKLLRSMYNLNIRMNRDNTIKLIIVYSWQPSIGMPPILTRISNN